MSGSGEKGFILLMSFIIFLNIVWKIYNNFNNSQEDKRSFYFHMT